MVQYLSRSEFLDDYWDYRPGQHVSLIEPTGGGKTQLMGQLLEKAVDQNPHLRSAMLMPKPKDSTTSYWRDRLGFRETADWPPAAPWPWQPKPKGYVLWPKHLKDADPDVNRQHLKAKFRTCIKEQYWKGASITVADDVHVLAVLMELNPDLEEMWTAGRSLGAGLWSCNQKPSGTLGGSVSSFSYNAPTHLFLGRDRDERNVKRFGEIGGIDPREVESMVRELKMVQIGDNAISEKLYIDKRGPYMAVIGV